MHTNISVLTRFGVPDLAQEFPELAVPIVTGPQCQGDVMVLPVTTHHAGVALGRGVEVVRSEAGGNTHMLHGDGLWEAARPGTGDGLVQGWLTVPAGGEAFLTHTEEHAALGLGAGTFEVRTQREFAGEWQAVVD